jgi:Flp pilus assembly protein protease CpaA
MGSLVIESTISIVVLLCMVPAAVMDCKTKLIDSRLFLYSAAPLVLLRLVEGICYGTVSLKNELLGIGIGIIFIMLSLISREALGLGDGVAILWFGVIMGGKALVIVLCTCLILNFFIAFVMVFKGKKKVRIPMLPFLTFGYLLYLADINFNLI